MPEIEVQIKEDVGDNEIEFSAKMNLEKHKHLFLYFLEDISWDKIRYSDADNIVIDNYVLSNHDELFEKFIVAHKLKVKEYNEDV